MPEFDTPQGEWATMVDHNPPPEDVYPIQDDSQPQIQLPPSVVTQRASKYHFALGKDSPGVTPLMERIIRGQEQDERARAVAQDDIRNSQERRVILQDWIKNNPPGSIPPEAIDALLDTSQSREDAVARANTIFETKYARKLVTGAHVASDGGDVLAEAQVENPEGTQQVLDRSEQISANREIALNELEQLEAELKAQGWGDYLGEIAETFIPFVSYSRYRNALEGAPPSEAVFLGNNILHITI
jgi:hypothetical protein